MRDFTAERAALEERIQAQRQKVGAFGARGATAPATMQDELRVLTEQRFQLAIDHLEQRVEALEGGGSR